MGVHFGPRGGGYVRTISIYRLPPCRQARVLTRGSCSVAGVWVVFFVLFRLLFLSSTSLTISSAFFFFSFLSLLCLGLRPAARTLVDPSVLFSIRTFLEAEGTPGLVGRVWGGGGDLGSSIVASPQPFMFPGGGGGDEG